MSVRPLAILHLSTFFALFLGCCEKVAAASDYLCHRDKMTYWIKVEYETPNSDLPCSVYRWVLPGEPELLWRATKDRDFCKAKAKEVEQKLVNYGWLCLYVGSSTDDILLESSPPKRSSNGARTPVM